VDHNSSNLSADLRRKRSEGLLSSLLSQLRALPQIWGSRGRRFESCYPDQISEANGPIPRKGSARFFCSDTKAVRWNSAHFVLTETRPSL